MFVLVLSRYSAQALGGELFFNAGIIAFVPGLLEVRQYTFHRRCRRVDHQLDGRQNDVLSTGIHWYSANLRLAGDHSLQGREDGRYSRGQGPFQTGQSGRVFSRDGAGKDIRPPHPHHPATY